MTKVSRAALAVVVLAVVVATAAAPSSADEDDAAKMRWGIMPGWDFQTGVFNDPNGTFPCTAQVLVWAQEIGISGVQRIRTHFELYGAYAALWMPSERSSSQVAYPRESGDEFPDDFRSYYVKLLMPWGLWFEESGDRVILDYVGERPSFWSPDIHEEVEVGTFACELGELPKCFSEYGSPSSCATEVKPDDVEGIGGADGVSDADQDGVDDTQDADDICPPGSTFSFRDVDGSAVCSSPGAT